MLCFTRTCIRYRYRGAVYVASPVSVTVEESFTYQVRLLFVRMCLVLGLEVLGTRPPGGLPEVEVTPSLT